MDRINLRRSSAGVLRASLLAVMSCILLAGAPSAEAESKPDGEVSLVLVLVVDQLAGEVLRENQDRFVDGGFRRLLDHGVVYERAFHGFAPTSTGPGHATLSTGAMPATHGIPANEWRSPDDGRNVYGVHDAGHRVLGRPTTESDGTSPANLQAESLADLLIESSSGAGRVYSVSMKDRTAILLAGRKGKALWYSKRSASFESSDYYFERLPVWVSEFNDDQVRPLSDATWTLARPRDSYVFGDRDAQSWERDYSGLGTTFPHELGDTRDFGAAIRFTPMADELLFELAGRILQTELLGQAGATDMLAIGLSATDYIGHAFGPDSLEAEDNLLRLDENLASFLELVDQTLGPGRMIVALSSDHGIPSAPEWTRMHEGGDVGRIDTPRMIEGLRDHLRAHFELEGDPILGFNHPSIFLDTRLLASGGVDIVDAEQVASDFVAGFEGMAAAYTRTDVLRGRVGGTRETDRVAAGFHATRSGNLVLVQEPGWHLDKRPDFFAVTHGSPYDYDAHVPMIFHGPGLRAASIEREVGTESFAPSVARYLALRSLAQADGDPLPEITRPTWSYNPAH